MDQAKSVENELQPETKRKYEKPVIMELGELASGVGLRGCGNGSSDAFCSSGGAAATICSTGTGN